MLCIKRYRPRLLGSRKKRSNTVQVSLPPEFTLLEAAKACMDIEDFVKSHVAVVRWLTTGNSVLIKFEKIEGIEKVHPDIVAEDMDVDTNN